MKNKRNHYINIILFALLFAFYNQTNKAQNLITNIYNRNIISLNGKWEYIVDLGKKGERRNIQYSKDDMGRSELWEHSFSKSKTLNVPGDWNTQDEKLFYYEGSIWYRKEFNLNRKEGFRYFLYFGAANYRSEIYLNTIKVGENVGGFTPFNFEITDILENFNSLIVNVDNRLTNIDVPTNKTDWWNYGGITRDVFIVEVPKTFVKDYKLQLKKNSKTEVDSWIYIDGSSKEELVKVIIPELEFKKEFNVKTKQIENLSFSIAPQLWSPENPKLYEIIIETDFEIIKDIIGFRSISTHDENLLLNGKEIFLRGSNIHEEKPFGDGRMNSLDEAKIWLTRAKELGCNFVRLAHYPHNEYMLKAADEIGLLVWSEIPVWQRINFASDTTLTLAKKLVNEMVTRDKNRCSIIIWSLSNETPYENPNRLPFLLNLREEILSKDSTRLIASALHKMSDEKNSFNINDPLGEYLDVIGINEYVGWYGKELSDVCADYTWKSNYAKPHVISEFGGGALYGFHGDIKTRWTEEFQEQLYKDQLSMLEIISFIKGLSPWILKDFRSPRRMLSGIQDEWNRKGLMSETGKKKKAYNVMQDYYKKMKEKYNNK